MDYHGYILAARKYAAQHEMAGAVAKVLEVKPPTSIQGYTQGYATVRTSCAEDRNLQRALHLNTEPALAWHR
eukprot:630763-Prorocentrum_minimum.AAC.1